MKERTEQEWYELFADEKTRVDAFSTVITLYQERIYWHIRRMVVTHDNANDVMQNTFIKAWRHIDKYRGDAKLSTWLFRIATNESIDYLNEMKRQAGLFSDDDSLFLQESLACDPYFDGDELQKELQKAILTLPDKQRLVFNMRYFEEMKYEKMADILGQTVGGLKASYHLAQKKIKEYFKAID